LATKVKAAARAKVGQRAPAPTPPTSASYKANGFVVGIGASTGGVEALLTVLAGFPENCPPTVVTQHMPASFTRSFAERLDRQCRPKVQEAFEDAPLLPGHIYVAPGGTHHLTV
ncbi:chemotaxis protein CheB, partial [Mycobacterium tuberculosis]